MTSPISIQGTGVFSPKLRQASVVRKQLGLGSSGYLGIDIKNDKGSVDPDEISLVVFFKDDFDTYAQTNAVGKMIAEVDVEIIRDSVGKYYYELGPSLTSLKGNITAVWNYVIAGVSYSYTDYVTIMEQMPTYQGLRDSEKLIVEQVSWMFGDLFDSTEGGPNLTENFQTHFGYERIAQLLYFSVNRINTMHNPLTDWTVGAGNGSGIPDRFTGLIVWGVYLEVLKHFIRSYVEQPDFKNMNGVTYTDRRDYMQRWQAVLSEEKPDFDKAVKLAKRKLLSLGSGSLLVGGGIFGSGGRGGLFQYGMYASQVRSYRFFPAAFAIGYVNHTNAGHPNGPWS